MSSRGRLSTALPAGALGESRLIGCRWGQLTARGLLFLCFMQLQGGCLLRGPSQGGPLGPLCCPSLSFFFSSHVARLSPFAVSPGTLRSCSLWLLQVLQLTRSSVFSQVCQPWRRARLVRQQCCQGCQAQGSAGNATFLSLAHQARGVSAPPSLGPFSAAPSPDPVQGGPLGSPGKPRGP